MLNPNCMARMTRQAMAWVLVAGRQAVSPPNTPNAHTSLGEEGQEDE